MECPYCNLRAIKYGTEHLKDGRQIQTYYCRTCHKRFNERTGTPMARLQTFSNVVGIALKMRTEGAGIRATGRILEKSHSTVMRWEKRVADMTKAWSPPAPPSLDVTVEGDELYTRVGRNFPPGTIPRVDN